MTDVVQLGISLTYGVLALLAATLVAMSIRARHPGEPPGRPWLLASGMICLCAQGLLVLATLLLGGVPVLTFVLYGSLLEVGGVALLLAAAFQ